MQQVELVEHNPGAAIDYPLKVPKRLEAVVLVQDIGDSGPLSLLIHTSKMGVKSPLLLNP